MSKFDDAVKYIMDIPKFQGKNTLEDTAKLLAKVYRDESSKVVHVAGTNGKGSTCSYMNSILQKSGFSVGLFTSPHLVSIRERIVINDVMISEDEFTEAFERIMDIIKEEGMEHHPSFFEYLFLMAMYCFAKRGVDYIILETGLGGRLDATNCVKSKKLCVITKIGLDHTEYLGNTVSQIAGEKAGIIKQRVPVVFWDNQDESYDAISRVAKDKNCACYSINQKDVFLKRQTKEFIDFLIECEYYRYDNLKISTVALYQIYNASLAVLGCIVLDEKSITKETIASGLFTARWAGRMEEVEPSVFLDGAHNPDGIVTFLESVKAVSCEGKRKLLFSVVADKQYDAMCRLIIESELFDAVYIGGIDSSRALDMESIGKCFADCPCEVFSFDSATDAFLEAKKSLGDKDMLFVAGSLYLVGQLKTMYS